MSDFVKSLVLNNTSISLLIYIFNINDASILVRFLPQNKKSCDNKKDDHDIT